MTNKYKHKGVLHLDVICQIEHQSYITEKNKKQKTKTKRLGEYICQGTLVLTQNKTKQKFIHKKVARVKPCLQMRIGTTLN